MIKERRDPDIYFEVYEYRATGANKLASSSICQRMAKEREVLALLVNNTYIPMFSLVNNMLLLL